MIGISMGIFYLVTFLVLISDWISIQLLKILGQKKFSLPTYPTFYGLCYRKLNIFSGWPKP